jgi:hypothetical protein
VCYIYVVLHSPCIESYNSDSCIYWSIRQFFFFFLYLKDGDRVIITKLSVLCMGVFMKTEGCERGLAYFG